MGARQKSGVPHEAGDTCHSTTVLPAGTCTLTFAHTGGSASDAVGAIYIDAGGAIAVLINMKAS